MSSVLPVSQNCHRLCTRTRPFILQSCFVFKLSSEFVTFTKLKENTEKWHLKRTTEGFAQVGHSVTDSELVDGRLTSQGHSVTDSELVDGRLTSQGYSRSTRL